MAYFIHKKDIALKTCWKYLLSPAQASTVISPCLGLGKDVDVVVSLLFLTGFNAYTLPTKND